MSDETQIASQSADQANADTRRAATEQLEEIRIDVYDEGVIEDGQIKLDFDPYLAQYIVTTEMDLMAVTADGQTYILGNYTDAVNSGFVTGIQVPGGGTFEADAVVEIAQTVDDLATALAEFESAAGEGDLSSQGGGPVGGFARLEIQDISGTSTEQQSEGPVGVGTTPTDELVDGLFEEIERDSINFIEAVEIAGPVDLEASDPTLILSGSAAGQEDGSIPLDITAGLTDLDGSETLELTISGIPEGAILSVGTVNEDGTVTIEAADLAGLTITPPPFSSDDFTLTVTATSTESASGDTAEVEDTILVEITGVANAPSLTVANAAGSEDLAIDLDIASALVDLDGSESLSLSVSGIPDGAVLISDGTEVSVVDGVAQLTADQLNNLTITPPANSSADFQLTVNATSTEADGDTATSTATIDVSVAAVSDAPTLTVSDAVASHLDASDGVVTGGDGDDVISGAGGSDTIFGGAGDDVITGDGDAQLPIAAVLDINAALGVDAGEVLTVTVSGLPAGASLTAGVVNADGSVTLTPEQADGVIIAVAPGTPDFELSVTATSTDTDPDGGVSTSSETAVINVAVDETNIAGADYLDGGAGADIIFGGAGDDVIIGGSGDDTIDTGTAGANGDVVDAGTGDDTVIYEVQDGVGMTTIDGGEGNDTLQLEMTGVQFVDPDVQADLRALQDHIEAGDTSPLTLNALNLFVENVQIVDLRVDGASIDFDVQADAATLTTDDAAGLENAAIALSIDAALTDTDGSETLSVELSGIPDGATLTNTAGDTIPVSGGTATLTADQLDGLAVTPAANDSSDFSLAVSVTTTETSTGDTATVNGSIDVTVTGVASEASMVVSDAAGTEDQAIDLSVAVSDVEAGDSASVTISDVPAGATLSAGTVNPDGSVTLTTEELAGLTITPATNDSSDFTLAVTVTTTDGESGDTATTTGSIAVSVAADADAPTLTVNDASGIEDQAIALDLSAALTDASESLSITISDIPSGATLSAGTVNPDGTVTLTAGELSGLTITPATNDSTDFTLAVSATSTDGSDTATTTGSIAVSVAADADAPTLTVNDASGTEDQAIALDLSAALTDASESLSITISDIPSGATLSAGTVNPDGTVTLTAGELSGLTITPATNDSTDFTLAVSATSTDGSDTATTTGSIAVSVAADADAPTLTVNNASGTENQAIALDLSAALTDASESLSITISDIPSGATLSAGTVNPDGTVTLTAGELSGLTITPSANDSTDFTLAVSATSTDGSDTATTTGSIAVSVTGTADAATLTVGDATGTEDQAIALSIDVSDVQDGDTAEITISDIPEGATLSAGTVNSDGSVTLTAAELSGLTITPATNDSSDFTLSVDVTTTDSASGDSITTSDSLGVSVAADADAPTLTVNNASGTEDQAIALDLSAALTDASESLSITISDIPSGATLSAGTVNPDGTVTLTAGELSGLTITPATNDSTDFTLAVSATSTDGSDTASTTGSIAVSVAADADAPTLTVNDASGTEDQAIALDLSAALTDASESLSITISDIPSGATLSAGTVNPDGTVTLTAGELSGLTITPATNDSTDFTLAVSATSTDGSDTATTTGSIAVSVAADADAPTLTVNDASGTEDQAIALDLSAALTDASESLSITISDIPSGATLSAGTVNPDGTVTLTAGELSGLTITPATNDSTDFTLAVSATSTDGSDTATTTGSIAVSVAADADAPTLTVNDASGTEDQAIALDLSAALTDASESLSITISDIPSGATLSAGTVNPDGTVTLTAGELSGLTITPATNDSTDFTLAVSATSTDGSDTATTTGSIAVSVAADADAPTLTVNDASGTEDQAIALDLSAALTDASESLSITISDIPSGATLSAGTVNPDGTVTLTAGELSGLTITPATNDSSDFTLAVSATSTDGSDTATTTGSIAVSVAADADAPTLTVNDASGTEDQAIALDLSAALTDASESLSITISDIPSGATLSAGTVNPDGTVTLTAGELSGLTITPAANDSTDFTLAVSATSTDGSDTATTTGSIAISVAADADTPTLTVGNVSGIEDQAIALDLSATLTDASESLSITISDIPNGATLTNTAGDTIAISGNTATLTADQLEGLSITPASNDSSDFSLGITATSTDGTDTATSTGSIAVTVAADADAPTLTVGSGDATVSLGTPGVSPVAFFNFSETSGSTVSDSMGGTSGTVVGSQVDLNTAGNDGSGIDFNVDNNLHVNVAHSDALNLTDGTMSVAFNDSHNADTLLSKGNPYDEPNSFELRIDGSNIKLVFSDDNGTTHEINGGSYTANEFNTASFSFGGDGLKLFLNGSEVASKASVTDGIDGNTDPLLIGINEDIWDDFNGVMDDVAVFDTQLSDSMISDIADTNIQTVIDNSTTDSTVSVPLSISASLTDSSETLSDITIADLPTGAVLTNTAGDTITITDGATTLGSDQFAGLTLTVPLGTEDPALSISATSTDGGDTATTTNVFTVDLPNAEPAELTIAMGEGTVSGADSGGPLGDIAITNANFEADSLSSGQYNGDAQGWTESGSNVGAWDTRDEDDYYSQEDGAHQGEQVAWAVNGSLSQTVGATFEADREFTLNVDVGDSKNASNVQYEINIYAGDQLVGTVTQDDFPTTNDAFITATLTVDGADFASDFSGFGQDLRIELASTSSSEVNFDSVSLSAAESPNAIGDSMTFPLDITATLTDATGAENVTVTVDNLPDGATLSAGTVNPDGTVSLTTDELTDLTVTAPLNSGDFDLTVTSTTTLGSDSATSSSTFAVDMPEATAPDLTVDVGDGVTHIITPTFHLDGSKTGGEPQDVAGGNTGEFHNGAKSETNNAFDGNSFKFDGSNDYIEVASDAANKPVSGTLSMWFRPDDDDADGTLASSDSNNFDTGGHFNLEIVDGQIVLRVQDTDSSTTLNSNINLEEDEWGHVAVTWDEDGVKLYVNGQLEDTDAFNTVLQGNENPWTFGATQRNSGDNVANNLHTHFDGRMDDIAIFDAVASPDSIASIFANESPLSSTDVNDSMTYALTVDVGAATGNDTISVSVDGLPSGATLTNTAGDTLTITNGLASLTTDQLAGLSVSVPAGQSEDFNLTVSATATDPSGLTGTTTTLAPIDVDGDGVVSVGEDITGGSGNDVFSGGDGNDVIDGGAGIDTVDYSNADGGITFDFASGTVTGADGNDTVSNVENAIGSAHADTITGDANDNVIQGGGGNDTLDGGAGTDTVSYEDAAGGVTVDLANGTVTGADGNDIVSNFENVTGSAHADTITGDSGDNVINGGGGADNLTGGDGADTFKFSLLDGTADTITDFSIADGDKLDVSDLVNVDDDSVIGNFVRITEDEDGNSIVQVDASGSGDDENFEDVAVLEGVTGLDISDVIDTGAPNPDAV